jgi:hypothetical protein
MGYMQELDALQRWIWTTAQLPSFRLTAAPPKLARPVVVWEAPSRSQDRNLGRWQYVTKVTQYATLYAADLAQLIGCQDLLGLDLADETLERKKYINQLPVFDQEGPTGVVIGQLREVRLHFGNAQGLDVPLRIEYEASYSRKRVIAPAPTSVATKIVTPGIT